MVHATIPLPGWGLLELAAAGEAPQGREQLYKRGKEGIRKAKTQVAMYTCQYLFIHAPLRRHD